MNDSGPYMTTGQIAKALRVAPRTVCKYIDQGLMGEVNRLPVTGPGNISHRRVPRHQFERFARTRAFQRAISFDAILVVGRELPELDGLKSSVASSSFEAGALLSSLLPQYVVVDWSIGRVAAAEIANGVTSLGGYSPIMVAVIPSPWDGDPHEFVRYGYPYSCESVTTEVLRGFLAKSLGAK